MPPDVNGVNMPETRPVEASSAGRPTYHHGHLATDLVHHTLTLLDERGADTFSLREAARAAGVSASAAYRHFSDRDQLLRAAAAVVVEELGEDIDAAMAAAGDAPGRAHALGHAYLAAGLAAPARFRLAFGPLGIGHPDGIVGAPPEGPRPQRAFVTVATELGLDPMRGALRLWVTVHGATALAVDGPLAPRATYDPFAILDDAIDALAPAT